MSNQAINTTGWVMFTKVSFAVAAAMIGVGIWGLSADLWVKGYFAMATVYLIGATFTLAKTVRDEQETKALTSRIDQAKTERLLMEFEKAA
jgi:hypothetical protein